MVLTRVLENCFEVAVHNVVKIRVYNEPSEKTVIEFLEKCGENVYYITSSINKNQKERFNRLMEKYGKYIVDPYGITPIE